MWRKDAKPNTQSSNVPEPAVTTPKPAQTSSNTNMTNPAPATSAAPTNISHTSTPASVPAAAPSVASSVPAANPVAPTAPRVNSTSVIGAGLKIQGEITGDSDLVVEGEAHGRIRMVNGRVTVATNGHVNADIEAIEISVDGNVQGGLKASDRVRLGPGSHVQGSVVAKRIAIEDGARLRGKVEMIRAGETAPAAIAAKPAGTGASTPNVNAVATTTPAATTTADAEKMKANAARVSGD